MPPKLPPRDYDPVYYIRKIPEGYYIPSIAGSPSFQGSCREIAKQLLIAIANNNRLAHSSGFIGGFYVETKPELKCRFDRSVACLDYTMDRNQIIEEINEELKQLSILIPFS